MNRDLKGADALMAHLSRDEWRKKASDIFGFMDIRIIQLIVARGQDDFLQNARSGFSGQGFHQEDFIEMFFQMRHRVAEHLKHAEINVGDVQIDEMVENARATGDVNTPGPRAAIRTDEIVRGVRQPVVIADG